MPVQSSPAAQHVYLLDRLRGGYVDAGEADGVSKVLSWFSAGRVRIADPDQPKSFPVIKDRPATGVDKFESGFDS